MPVKSEKPKVMSESDAATWARVAAIKSAAEEKKAEDLEIFDLRTFSVVSEYFVVMTTLSPPHAQAVADEIQGALDGLLHIERDRNNTWVLMDYGDVVVHIFQPESRKYYSLERLWGDMSVVPTGAKKAKKAAYAKKGMKFKKSAPVKKSLSKSKAKKISPSKRHTRGVKKVSKTKKK